MSLPRAARIGLSSPAGATPRHADLGDSRYRRARRWTVGVLVAATLALAVWVALLLLGAWLVGSAYDLLTGKSSGGVDLAVVAADVLPGLLVGWCAGLASLAVIVRGEALGPRACGLASGALGTAVGAALLSATSWW